MKGRANVPMFYMQWTFDEWHVDNLFPLEGMWRWGW
jgi:hypothetical protein